MSFKKILFFFLLFSASFAFTQVKIGQWIDHLSYKRCNSVAKVNHLVYVSNGSGLAKFNTDDNSVEKMTKIEGLSDIGVKLLRKNDYNNMLLVIYDNANIDVIKPDGTITNVSDIKRKVVAGKKNINEVYFNANIAYLSCGFGIIVFDTEKLEIKDTYYIGNGVTNKEIYQTTQNDTAMFAATESGVYYGSSRNDLSRYQNWKSLNTGIAPGPYNSIIRFNGKILANYSARLKSNSSMADTIYQYDGLLWSKYPYKSNSENKKMLDFSKYNKVLIIDQFGVQDLDKNGFFSAYITNYGNARYAEINDVAYENDGYFWLADQNYGFIRSQGGHPYPNDLIELNGPVHNLVNDMDIKNGTLAVAPIYLGEQWNNTWNTSSPNFYKNSEWKNMHFSFMDTIYDVNCVAIDPNDNNHVALGSWGKGVIELRNEALVKIYNTSNSPLIAAGGSLSEARVGGLVFDSNSNLWVTTSLNNKCLNVLTKSGTWKRFDFNSVSNFKEKPNVAKVLVGKNGLVWIQLTSNEGMIVFNPTTSFSQPNNSNTKMITQAIGSGKLPSSSIYCMTEDTEGHIWVGTSKGITVFYDPENVFTGSNWDSQQILIEQDGHVQILLENDNITAIAIDGANRKWIGTESSGAYCLSADGQQQIYHFTTDNSPLYSNMIRDIVTDETTGDVFFGTEKGIQSYRTSIIKGFEDFENVHAYPNPVRPNYAGNVAITGLIDEAIVKITDIAGNLVWHTKSEGGQIEWNLQNFNGARVASGVYLIYCASSSGDKSTTAKLMVIN